LKYVCILKDNFIIVQLLM